MVKTPLRRSVLRKAKGRCEQCSKLLAQMRWVVRLLEIREYVFEKVVKEKAHIWRKDGNPHNIDLDNLELICDVCYNERKTTH